MTSVGPERILPASDRVLLAEYENLEAVLGHFAALEAAQLTSVRELIPAASTIMVHYDPAIATAAELAAQIRQIPPVNHTRNDLEMVTIDVVYTGEDIDEVATSLDVGVDELIRRHTGATWTGAFAGFAPGFVYCAGDDPLFDVARRSSPRTRIPAGSVAVASHFSAIYPRESPGGWQLIGHTAQRMWDLDRETPAAIQPGQQVRYRAIRDAATLTQPASNEASLPTVQGGTPYLEVVRPGALALLQDAGRPGMSGLGVSASGAADRLALRMANRTVGNPANVGALEIAGGGAELKINARTVIALTGAPGAASIVSAEDGVLPITYDEPTAVEPGDRIRIGALSDGIRCYIAVRGGYALPQVLNSLATDTLSGIGPAPLAAGDRLPLGSASGAVSVQPSQARCQPTPSETQGAQQTCELRVALGPRTDWFTVEAVDRLAGQTWTVTPRSDRVGLRLQGEQPMEREITQELPSEGAVTGAIQVPPNGQPVLFMPDHPLTGGYPIIGAVIDADLDRAGQLAPGMKLRFRVVQDFIEF